MGRTSPKSTYELEAQQNDEIIALAGRRNEEPQQLVRDAVAKYLVAAEYAARCKVALTTLAHPERDHRMFGAWRGADIDGIQYRNDLRRE